jgi:hypothetical protein
MTDELVARATALAQAAGKHIGADVRELGAVPAAGVIPERDEQHAQLAARTIELLRDELALVSRVRAEFANEKEHGAPASSSLRLEAMAARLEGMTRLALLLQLISPAEARAIWTEARQAGVRDRSIREGDH